MVGWWNPADVMEETPLLYDNFDPLKECLVDPDPVQLQNPCEFSNISLESHGLHYNGVELESSIDVKMEEVILLKISDRVHGEVGSNENGGGNDEEINFVTRALEAQKIAPPLPSEVGTCEGQIDNEVERISEVAESDSGDSSSNDSSSDESTSIAESVSSSEDEDDIGMRRRDNVADELEEGEVRELDAHEIDFLSDEEEEGPKGPIKSKHEVENAENEERDTDIA
ncbi:hypothetical protein KSP40_PGU005575 [Platanthera guangdongensis]|uniref:Uncharacterized protein n=1 Tax=Platanthera guangdongensis TaxID=2320717 RepID=A0ABR2LV06_9ASPA